MFTEPESSQMTVFVSLICGHVKVNSAPHYILLNRELDQLTCAHKRAHGKIYSKPGVFKVGAAALWGAVTHAQGCRGLAQGLII